MEQAVRDKIISIIDETEDMTIATVRDDAFPQATTVSYVNDGLSIYFGTTESSQKARNISRNNRVSATINRPYENWDNIVGLSIGGHATAVPTGGEFDKVARLLFKKFPQINDYVFDKTEQVAFFRIDPVVVSLLDYRLGFGHTELFTV